MIISVSRRTDIPAFYSEWFFNRLKEGYVYVINPFNRKQVSRIPLNPQSVDCFVFWTKDPLPMINRLAELKDYNYYFQFTLTSYRQDVEVNLRPKKEIIKTFKELSTLKGRDRVIWRYDPVFLNEYYNKEYHYEWFEKFMKELCGYTEKCVISFLDFYKKTERNMKHLNIAPFKEEDIYEIAEKFSEIGRKYGILVEACSERLDLCNCGINKSRCIDGDLAAKIMGCRINVKKDDTQREECGCAKSIDIGQYNTCRNNCAYCYANFDHDRAEGNFKRHNSCSPLITGELAGDECITERKMESFRSKDLLASAQERFDI
jgi:hypothetical protein